MADTNNQYFTGTVNEVNGIKAENVYISQSAPCPRKQYIHEILATRNLSSEFESLINLHAEKAYGTRYFLKMPDQHLTEMHEFAMKLNAVWESQQRDSPSFVEWVVKLFRRVK